MLSAEGLKLVVGSLGSGARRSSIGRRPLLRYMFVQQGTEVWPKAMALAREGNVTRRPLSAIVL